MYDFLKKHGVTLAFGIGGLLVALTLISISSGLPEGADIETLLTEEHNGIFDIGLYATYFLVFVATISALGAFILQAATNFNSAKPFLMGIGVLVVTWAVIYFGFSSPEVTVTIQENAKLMVTDETSIMIDSGLKLTYALVFVAAGAILFSSVRDLIK